MRQLIIILWICFSGVGLMSCSPQNINRDVVSWYPYKMIIDRVEVSFKLPPGGKISNNPPLARVDTRNMDESEIGHTSLASVGYDYRDSLPGFYFYCGLIRYTKLSESKRTMEDLIKDITERRKQYNEISTMKYNMVSSEVVTINERKWLNQYHHTDYGNQDEAYYILFNDTHYLVFNGIYGVKISKNEERLADRRKLLKEIVSTITIKQ